MYIPIYFCFYIFWKNSTAPSHTKEGKEDHHIPSLFGMQTMTMMDQNWFQIPPNYLIFKLMRPVSDGSESRPVHFIRDWDRNLEKGPGLTQAQDQFFEKGLENLDFYVVKNRGPWRLGIDLLWRAWARAWLEIDIQGSGSAWDQFFRARPITTACYGKNSLSQKWEFLVVVSHKRE